MSAALAVNPPAEAFKLTASAPVPSPLKFKEVSWAPATRIVKSSASSLAVNVILDESVRSISSSLAFTSSVPVVVKSSSFAPASTEKAPPGVIVNAPADVTPSPSISKSPAIVVSDVAP